MNVSRGTGTAGTIELVRAYVYQRARVPVISAVHANDLATARVSPRKAQRKFVCFASRANEETYTQRIRERGAQTFAKKRNVLMKVSGVGIQYCDLVLGGFHYPRVTVTYVSDIIDRIEIGATVGIVEVLFRTLHYVQRLTISDAQRRTQMFVTNLTYLVRP
jgi:hypothetical protein